MLRDDAANPEQDVGRVLRSAGRRVEPPEDLKRTLRAAVEAEWRTACGQRSRRRRVGLAVAAAVVLAGVAVWLVAPLPRAPGERMAEVTVAVGSVAARASWPGNWQPIAPHHELTVGEVLATGADGRAALTLAHDLSIRLDHGTRIT